MTESTKPVDLDEMERQLGAATFAPWLRSQQHCDAVICQPTSDIRQDEIDWYGGKLICESVRSENLDLIVALRNAAPALIAELRKLRALRDEIEPVLRDIASPPTTDSVFKLELRSRAYDILARHYDKKEPTK